MKIGDTIAIRKPQPFVPWGNSPLSGFPILDQLETNTIQTQAQLDACRRGDIDGFLKLHAK